MLSWCLWFCCAVSQPPQLKYNPLCCPLRLKDGSHYSVSMSAVHHTITLTHTQLSAAHTNHICLHTFKQTCAQTQKCTHTHSAATVVNCCLLHAFLILSLSLIPSHPSSPAWVCAVWHWQMLPSPSAPLKETLVYFPFLHPQACVVVFFGCFHPFMPMKIGPIEWMEMVLFHSFKRRNAIRK